MAVAQAQTTTSWRALSGAPTSLVGVRYSRQVTRWQYFFGGELTLYLLRERISEAGKAVATANAVLTSSFHESVRAFDCHPTQSLLAVKTRSGVDVVSLSVSLNGGTLGTIERVALFQGPPVSCCFTSTGDYLVIAETGRLVVSRVDCNMSRFSEKRGLGLPFDSEARLVVPVPGMNAVLLLRQPTDASLYRQSSDLFDPETSILDAVLSRSTSQLPPTIQATSLLPDRETGETVDTASCVSSMLSTGKPRVPVDLVFKRAELRSEPTALQFISLESEDMRFGISADLPGIISPDIIAVSSYSAGFTSIVVGSNISPRLTKLELDFKVTGTERVARLDSTGTFDLPNGRRLKGLSFSEDKVIAVLTEYAPASTVSGLLANRPMPLLLARLDIPTCEPLKVSSHIRKSPFACDTPTRAQVIQMIRSRLADTESVDADRDLELPVDVMIGEDIADDNKDRCGSDDYTTVDNNDDLSTLVLPNSTPCKGRILFSDVSKTSPACTGAGFPEVSADTYPSGESVLANNISQMMHQVKISLIARLDAFEQKIGIRLDRIEAAVASLQHQ